MWEAVGAPVGGVSCSMSVLAPCAMELPELPSEIQVISDRMDQLSLIIYEIVETSLVSQSLL